MEVQEFVKGLRSIPSIPQVALSAQRMLANPDASLRDAADVLARDPGLSARICKLASSPLFAGTSKDYTIQQAVLRIGAVETRRLVTTVAAMNAVPELPKPLSILSFWRLGLGTALAARRLAEDLGFDSPDAAYMAGLLHCLGEAAFAVNRPKEFAKIFRRSCQQKLELALAIEDALGLAPALITAELLRDWGIEGRIVEAIQFYPNPSEAPHERLFAAILFSAHRICHALGLALESDGDGDEDLDERMPAEMVERFESLGYPDATSYLLRKLQFMLDIEDLVRETFCD